METETVKGQANAPLGMTGSVSKTHVPFRIYTYYLPLSVSYPAWPGPLGALLSLPPLPWADLGFHGVLCAHEQLHLACLAFWHGNGAVSLQVEVLLATDIQLSWGRNERSLMSPDRYRDMPAVVARLGCQLGTSKHLGTSTGELSPSDCLVGMTVGYFLH